MPRDFVLWEFQDKNYPICYSRFSRFCMKKSNKNTCSQTHKLLREFFFCPRLFWIILLLFTNRLRPVQTALKISKKNWCVFLFMAGHHDIHLLICSDGGRTGGVRYLYFIVNIYYTVQIFRFHHRKMSNSFRQNAKIVHS